MKGADAEPETGSSPTIDVSLPATQTALRRPAQVIERKLDELDAWLTKALASRPRRSDVDGSLFTDIGAKTDFLRMLIAAERDSYRGALPEHLVDVEWRFGVLERTIEDWAQSGVTAPTKEEEEPDEAAAGSASGSVSGSGGCSCTDSCSGFEVMGKEAAFDAKCNLDQDDAEAHKDKEAAAVAATAAAAAPIEVPSATRTTARRRWWTRRAALCGAAAVVAVVALGAGLALEFAAVAQQSAYVVPT
jgi:hypothetical protein